MTTHDDTIFDPTWLRGLCDRAQIWVKETGGLMWANAAVPTNAYVDLLFSFALASLGDYVGSRELLRRAESVLSQETNEVHCWLLPAFRYRITQALDRKAHCGLLPAETLKELELLPKSSRYAVDRLRRSLRTLEPDVRPNPYRHWASRLSAFQRELADLTVCPSASEVASRIVLLLATLSDMSAKRGFNPVQERVIVLTDSLQLAPVAGIEFASSILQQVPSAYEKFSAEKDQSHRGYDYGVSLLREAVKLTRFFDQEAIVLFAANHLSEFLKAGDFAAASGLAEPCLRWLQTHHRRAELANLCEQLASAVPLDYFPVSLPVAAAWMFLNQPDRAESILESARTLLFSSNKAPKKQRDLRFSVAKMYVEAITFQPANLARSRLEELFTGMTGVRDTFTTAHLFSASQLSIIDAFLLAGLERDRPMPLHVG